MIVIVTTDIILNITVVTLGFPIDFECRSYNSVTH